MSCGYVIMCNMQNLSHFGCYDSYLNSVLILVGHNAIIKVYSGSLINKLSGPTLPVEMLPPLLSLFC